MTRYNVFQTVFATATRILAARDTQPNRTAAYANARCRAEAIALRNVRMFDAARKAVQP